VPILTLFLHLKQHEAHGTSLAVILPIAASGVAAYALQEYVNWSLVLSLAVGSGIGAVLGARLMARLPARGLRRGFAALLLMLGLRLIIWGNTGV
jgi:hypothetical protein